MWATAVCWQWGQCSGPARVPDHISCSWFKINSADYRYTLQNIATEASFCLYLMQKCLCVWERQREKERGQKIESFKEMNKAVMLSNPPVPQDGDLILTDCGMYLKQRNPSVHMAFWPSNSTLLYTWHCRHPEVYSSTRTWKPVLGPLFLCLIYM